MLRTAFIGNENFYDQKICEWLSQHTDLSLIIWTDKMTWSFNDDGQRNKRIKKRFIERSKKYGKLRAANEFLYYILYRKFIGRDDLSKVRSAVDSIEVRPKRDLSQIEQIRPDNIKSKELQDAVEACKLDAMFAMCIDVYLPKALINTPKYGTFLWHEGITPNYRGVYSPFWALVNKDYDNLGYTLLRMNSKLDAGEVYVQGKAENIDLVNDWHSYIGHKAVLDSLPKIELFLKDLNANQHRPIDRSNAQDGYYSYPTASSLLKLMMERKFFKNSIPRNGNRNGK
ncbi:MAG: formyltransferase family protein [Pyrinomonadaceae bacterium]